MHQRKKLKFRLILVLQEILFCFNYVTSLHKVTRSIIINNHILSSVFLSLFLTFIQQTCKIHECISWVSFMELTKLGWNYCGIRNREGRRQRKLTFTSHWWATSDPSSRRPRENIPNKEFSSLNREERRFLSTGKDKSLSHDLESKENGFCVDTVYTLHGRNSDGIVASSITRRVCSGKYSWGHVHIRNHLQALRYLCESDIFAVRAWISLITRRRHDIRTINPDVVLLRYVDV